MLKILSLIKQADLNVGNVINRLKSVENHPEVKKAIADVNSGGGAHSINNLLSIAEPHLNDSEKMEILGAQKKTKLVRDIITNPEEYQKSFKHVVKNSENSGKNKYMARSDYFNNDGGYLEYTDVPGEAVSKFFKKDPNSGMWLPGSRAATSNSVEVNAMVRRRGINGTLETAATKDLAEQGYAGLVSDTSARTSTHRQAAHEKNREMHPDQVQRNEEFKQAEPAKGPLYLYPHLPAWAKILSDKNPGVAPVMSMQQWGERYKHLNPDKIIPFASGKLLKGKQRFELYEPQQSYSGANWNIDIAYPHGYSAGSIDPKLKDYNSELASRFKKIPM